MDPITLLKGVVPPVLVALALVSAGGNKLLPFAAGLGLAMAYYLLKDWPLLPHELWVKPNGIQWLLWSVLAAALCASLEHWRVLPVRLAMTLGIALGGAAVWLVLQKVASHESTGWAVLHIGGGGAAVGLLSLGGRRLVERAASSPFVPFLVCMVLSADAVVLVMGDSALFAQLCGASAAAVGAAIATSLWRRPFVLAGADGMWFGLVHGLFLLAGVHLAELTWPAAGLALVAPLLPLAMPKSFAKERPKRWMVLVLLLAGLPAGAAIWLA